MSYEEICEGLDRTFPDDLHEKVDKNKSGIGRELTYVENIYVMERLDQVLGKDGWRWESTTILCNENTYLVNGTLFINFGTRENPYWVARSCASSEVAATPARHGFAAKTANTEALKKAASYFGVARYLYTDDSLTYLKEQDKAKAKNDLPPKVADLGEAKATRIEKWNALLALANSRGFAKEWVEERLGPDGGYFKDPDALTAFLHTMKDRAK